MGRKSGFNGIINAIAKDMARNARQREIQRQRQIREQERNCKKMERERLRLHKEHSREQKQLYLQSRLDETAEMNLDLQERNTILGAILEHTLKIDDTIKFDTLRIKENMPEFVPPKELTEPKKIPVKNNFFQDIKEPTGLLKVFPGAKRKYEEKLNIAENEYNKALTLYQKNESERQRKLEDHKITYEKKKKEFESKKLQRNMEVNDFEAAYNEGIPEAIKTYNSMVLERSKYPDGFPQEFRIAYVEESKELVVEYQFPDINVVPDIEEYKYIKAKDEIAEKARNTKDIKQLYQDILAGISLRTIHEIFEADQGNHIDVFVFNGYVETVDPATGKDIKPMLLSVRTTKISFNEIDLNRVDKKICLKNLGAQFSRSPEELQAIKPIVEFDMVDKRFVDQQDVISGLDTRPNLMDLNPFEFENLVSNLFSKMGLETKQTRSSKDGGVDAIAFDHRPILGGKVVIQAKRYKNVVGVSAVRDLYGTMMNEGANKGILVTTSGYGPDAYDFGKEKPIEMIDGGGLLYLLEQQGIKAKIIIPNE